MNPTSGVGRVTGLPWITYRLGGALSQLEMFQLQGQSTRPGHSMHLWPEVCDFTPQCPEFGRSSNRPGHILDAGLARAPRTCYLILNLIRVYYKNCEILLGVLQSDQKHSIWCRLWKQTAQGNYMYRQRHMKASKNCPSKFPTDFLHIIQNRGILTGHGRNNSRHPIFRVEFSVFRTTRFPLL